MGNLAVGALGSRSLQCLKYNWPYKLYMCTQSLLTFKYLYLQLKIYQCQLKV